MNSVFIMGRLTRDADVRTGNGDVKVASYRVAVDRRFKREGQPEADFFDCVAFGRQAEFAEKYLRQGIKMVIQGRLQNDNYQDKEGRMVYRTQIVVENQEFAESKAASQRNTQAQAPQAPFQPQQQPQPQAQAPQYQPQAQAPQYPAQPAYGAAPQQYAPAPPQPQAPPMTPPTAWQPSGDYAVDDDELPFS